MNTLGHKVSIAALAATLAAGCGGRMTQSDAGAGDHDATEQDAVPDTPIEAGPRVRDVCPYSGPDAQPLDPDYPYLYTCHHEMSDPDCIAAGVGKHGPDAEVDYLYDCKTPP